jgi:RNA polymerase sigma-70 factor (ECF subfamily)
MVAGDDSALAAVYDRYAGLVFGLARRVTGDEEAAREVTQDVFTMLWQQPDKVDLSRGTLKSYLGVVGHRRAVDVVRRVSRRARVEGGLAAPSPVVGADAPVIEEDTRAWQSHQLSSLIRCLPEEERSALVLAYYEGHTYREVADMLGIPEGTAKSRLRRALSRLRDVLKSDELAWTT